MSKGQDREPNSKNHVRDGEHLAAADRVHGAADTRSTRAEMTSEAEKAAKNHVLDIPRSAAMRSPRMAGK